jgi:hypothetical protein
MFIPIIRPIPVMELVAVLVLPEGLVVLEVVHDGLVHMQPDKRCIGQL